MRRPLTLRCARTDVQTVRARFAMMIESISLHAGAGESVIFTQDEVFNMVHKFPHENILRAFDTQSVVHAAHILLSVSSPS